MKWDNESDLWLLREDELDLLPDGTELLSINNDYVKKDNSLDKDTRFGYLAYGLTEELATKQNLHHQFLLLKIRG